MILGSFIFGITLFFISIFLLIETLHYPYKAMLFPLLTLFPVLILLIIQIISEIPALKRRNYAGVDIAKVFSIQHLIIGIWMASTLLILWTFGFIATVILLPLLYLRYQKESWKLSISMSLGSGIFFYVLFDLCLKMPLYPGLLFIKLS